MITKCKQIKYYAKLRGKFFASLFPINIYASTRLYDMSSSKKRYCFVPNCKVNSDTAPDKIFLSVPKTLERRRRWFKAVGIPFLVGTKVVCCEDHFDLESDCKNWMEYKLIGTRLFLKDNVVPHKFECCESPVKEESQMTSSSKKRKRMNIQKFKSSKVARQLFEEDPQPSTSAHPATPIKPISSIDQSSSAESPSGHFIITETIPKETTSTLVHKGVQVKMKTSTKDVGTTIMNTLISTGTQTQFLSQKKSLKPPLASLSPSEDEPSTSSPECSQPASISSEAETVICKVKTNRLESTLYLCQTNCRLYLGLPEVCYNVVKHLSVNAQVPHEHIFVTLKKIRLNDSFLRLSLDFQMSVANVHKIFKTSAPKLASVLQDLIFWPTAAEIKKLLPLSFRARYRNVQSIIDCFEVEIMKPSDPVKQTLTWSDYKKTNTLKYLISATPNGLINFISGGYGGRISDTEIIKQSQYLNKLPSECAVMADRGFKHIAPLLAEKNCELIRPPSVAINEKLSKEEVRAAKTIASLRIHVERVIRRVREYEMLTTHACTHPSLLYLMNHITVIVCALVNTQGPLIK